MTDGQWPSWGFKSPSCTGPVVHDASERPLCEEDRGLLRANAKALRSGLSCALRPSTPFASPGGCD